MKRMDLARTVLLLMVLAVPAEAGLFSHKHSDEEVPGSHPQQLVAPNGVVVPLWASKRMQESPVPLFGKSWGRRPWVLPLSTQATPSAVMARSSQLGFGVGPTPGASNGYGLAGNYPTASVGPGNGNGWAPRGGLRNLFMPNNYPYTTGLTGY